MWGSTLKEQDVVFVGDDPVLIQGCIQIEGTGIALLVSPLLQERRVNRVAALCRVDVGNVRVLKEVDCAGVAYCRAWCIEPDGSYLVVSAGSVY